MISTTSEWKSWCTLFQEKNNVYLCYVAITGAGGIFIQISELVFMHYKVKVQIILATSVHLHHNLH